jgi:hypothetical protein
VYSVSQTALNEIINDLRRKLDCPSIKHASDVFWDHWLIEPFKLYRRYTLITEEECFLVLLVVWRLGLDGATSDKPCSISVLTFEQGNLTISLKR